MGPFKKPPFSGQSSVTYFDTFYTIKRVSDKNENFSNVSPFLVEKAITSSVGTVTSTKLMRSGDLLVEVASLKQAQQILKSSSFSAISISIQPHITLNTSKGVITCGRLSDLSNEEITQELTGQGVKDVQRINIRQDGELMPTKNLILMFNTPRLPEYIKAGYIRCSVRPYIPNPLRCFKCQRFGHFKTNCRGTLTCARCAMAGHESTGCMAVEKCVNCQGKHTSFSRSCPNWELEKEIVITKFKNSISFPEARRLVKAQTAIEGKSYASVIDKKHPFYQTTHCHHVVAMSNFPSNSKSSQPVPIASSSVTANENISPQSSSKTSKFPPASKNSSGFQIVKNKKKPKAPSKSQSVNNNQVKPDTASKFWKKSPSQTLLFASVTADHKSNKNKPDKNETSNAKAVNLPSDSSRGNSSDSESFLSVTSAPEIDLPAKLKKSAHKNSVALELADRCIVHKDLPSIFGGMAQVPDVQLHPSEEDEDLQMNCDVSTTPPCVPPPQTPTLS
ncbi:hypothetical protein AVEN_239143-1 [Araneus ventricosus]|uniref:CCHC-type domain-containing protein n=1 Tax=Araneus ventricosus TaxID=182803 RepID=A0A4Y2H6F1_ARAVE|nr:hypothetical protein AVEN_239143-1 [Araneus ventricosus]